MSDADTSALITPAEIAALTQESIRTVYSWLNRGTIPSTSSGRRRIVTRAAFERWLSGEKPEPLTTSEQVIVALRGMELTVDLRIEATVNARIVDVRPARKGGGPRRLDVTEQPFRVAVGDSGFRELGEGHGTGHT